MLSVLSYIYVCVHACARTRVYIIIIIYILKRNGKLLLETAAWATCMQRSPYEQFDFLNNFLKKNEIYIFFKFE